MPGLNKLSAVELRRGLAGGRFSAVEVTQDLVARIQEREPEIHAWQYFSADICTEQAMALDERGDSGKLHGIPVGIKDIMDTCDMPTGYGSTIYHGNQPGRDASVVAALRQSGAVIAGKTVSTEFAYFQPGPTLNPVDPDCTPGGSSSGSAAAVADCMVPVAFGSQTAGSLTRPASYCGVVGFKPSYGVHSLVGVKALSHSLDTLGWMTRSVPDAALVRATLLGQDFEPPKPGLDRTPRLGVCRTAEWQAAEQDTQDAIETAAGKLSRAGAAITEVKLDEAFTTAVDAQKTIMAFEVARSLAWEWSRHREQLSDSISALISDGLACSESSYLEACRLSVRCRRAIEKVFSEYDALLTPSAPGEAPEGIAATGDPIFSRLWTLLHLPSITLPGYKGRHDRPVGIQLVGGYLADEDVLRIAEWAHPELSG